MVTAGGVKNWDSYLSASVTFYGVGNWVVFIDVAAMIRVLEGRVLKLTKSNPPVTKLEKEKNLDICKYIINLRNTLKSHYLLYLKLFLCKSSL